MRKVPVTQVNTKPKAEKSAPAPIEEESLANPTAGSITVRPDGYYWRSPDSNQEFGPFESRAQALADRAATDEEAPEPGESVQEAADEIGMADWIDPETGEPAEGQSRPRLDDE